MKYLKSTSGSHKEKLRIAVKGKRLNFSHKQNGKVFLPVAAVTVKVSDKK